MASAAYASLVRLDYAVAEPATYPCPMLGRKGSGEVVTYRVGTTTVATMRQFDAHISRSLMPVPAARRPDLPMRVRIKGDPS